MECSICFVSLAEEGELRPRSLIPARLPKRTRKCKHECKRPDQEWPQLICPPCGHTFHRCCMMDWLETCKSCPICRKPINPRHFRAIYLTITEPDPNEIHDLEVQEDRIAALEGELELAKAEIEKKEKEFMDKVEEMEKQQQLKMKAIKEQIENKLKEYAAAHTPGKKAHKGTLKPLTLSKIEPNGTLKPEIKKEPNWTLKSEIKMEPKASGKENIDKANRTWFGKLLGKKGG